MHSALRALLPESAELPEKSAERWSRAMHELLAGGGAPEAAKVLAVTFDVVADQLIVVRDIPFVSVCEHHLLPFTGTATVGYIPEGNRVVGLSKIPRAVYAFAKRLQVQERLTREVADAMVAALKPRGVGVVVTAMHMCASLRGARAVGSNMVTSELRGVLREDPQARAEFMALAR